MENKGQSLIYIFILFAITLVFMLVIFFYPSLLEWKFIISGVVMMGVMLLGYWKIEWLVVSLIAMLPVISGLEPYQIDVSSFLQLVGVNHAYQIDGFLLARIFILFIALVEIIKRGWESTKTPLFYVFLFSMAFNIIPFIQSEYKVFGLAYYWFFLVSAFGAYFLGYFLLGSKKGYLITVGAILASSIFPMIVGLKQIVLRQFFYENDSTLPRLQSVFDHPNKFGSFLFIVLLVYLVSYLSVYFKKGELQRKEISFMPFIILGFYFAATFSRTSWIALAMGVGCVAILRKEIRVLTVYFSSLAIFLAMFVEKLRSRILGIFIRQYNDTLSGRIETWDNALYVFRKNPWIGYGPGSFKEMIKLIRGTDIGNFYPHSDAIRFMVEGGVLGLISYLLYAGYALYYSFISYWQYPAGFDRITVFGKELEVDFKLLGVIPFLLFFIMIPYSFLEAPSLDYIYLTFAWTLLGSWLGLVSAGE